MKGANFLPLLAAVAVAIQWFWLSHWPANWLWLFLAIVLVNLLVSFWLSTPKVASRWWNFSLLPFLAQTTVFGYAILSTVSWLVVVLMLLVIVFVYVYWRYVYFYFKRSARYQSFSLENLSFYINFLIIYFGGTVLFGLRVLLNYSLFYLISLSALLILAVNYQLLWVSKVDWSKYRPYLWLDSLLLTELFWVLLFLPLDYNLLGFFWASCFYLLMSLFNDLLSHKNLQRRLFWYALFMLIGWLALLLTAKWL